MNRPARLLSSLALAAAWAASPVLASAPRLLALGGDGAFLEDAVNARVWYGSLVDHGGWLAAESGVFEQHGGYARDLAGGLATAPAVGAHLPVGAEGRHGTAGLWWNGRAANGGIGELGDDLLENAWQVQYARRLGAVTAGLSLRHGRVDRDLAADLHRNASRDDFGLGLRCNLGAGAYLDLAGELVRLADESSLGAAAPEPRATAGSWGLRGRVFWQVADGLVLTPLVDHRQEKRSWDELARADQRRWRLWRLGAGLTWLPDPDHLVLVAADWRNERNRAGAGGADEWVATADVLDLRLAVEARIHALLTVRLASGYRYTGTEVGGASSARQHDIPLSAGLAAHVGPVDLDLALSSLPPPGPDGLREPWRPVADATWLNVGLSFWF